MMKIEIKHRFTGNVLYACEASDLREGVMEAASKGADLGGAYLGGAYLRGAYLRDADLGGADLRGADLRDADLRGADLGDADLGGADLRDADLRGADLGGEKLAIAPISILNLAWDISISESYLVIGCQRHTHDEWANFSDYEIKSMEPRALEFWASNKSWILSACESHKKQSLEYRAKRQYQLELNKHNGFSNRTAVSLVMCKK